MNLKQLSREQKENIYIEKMTELQLRWRNPINDITQDFASDLTDEELRKGIEQTISQLKFEKGLSAIKKVVLIPIVIFVILGILGLLLLGIRQIF